MTWSHPRRQLVADAAAASRAIWRCCRAGVSFRPSSRSRISGKRPRRTQHQNSPSVTRIWRVPCRQATVSERTRPLLRVRGSPAPRGRATPCGRIPDSWWKHREIKWWNSRESKTDPSATIEFSSTSIWCQIRRTTSLWPTECTSSR